jgi:hypothetical protein
MLHLLFRLLMTYSSMSSSGSRSISITILINTSPWIGWELLCVLCANCIEWTHVSEDFSVSWIVPLQSCLYLQSNTKMCKVIAVTEHGGPWGCQTSNIQYFLNNGLSDAGEVKPAFTPRRITGTHFQQRLRRTQAYSEAGSFRWIENSHDFTGKRTATSRLVAHSILAWRNISI